MCRTVLVTLGLASAAQLALAFYRAGLEQSTPVYGVLAAAIVLLPVLRYRDQSWARTLCRGVGFASLALGAVLIYGAIVSPVTGLVQRVSVPGLGISFGALLILDPAEHRRRLLALLVFALAFIGGQVVMNHEAQHVRALRTEGIHHHWH